MVYILKKSNYLFHICFCCFTISVPSSDHWTVTATYAIGILSSYFVRTSLNQLMTFFFFSSSILEQGGTVIISGPDGPPVTSVTTPNSELVSC